MFKFWLPFTRVKVGLDQSLRFARLARLPCHPQNENSYYESERAKNCTDDGGYIGYVLQTISRSRCRLCWSECSFWLS